MNAFKVEARIRGLADKAASDFLSPISEKCGSPEYKIANAEEILKEAGADLSEAVAKIASEEDLNPHEVARLCEEANKETFSRLYKDSADKTFEFKVADAERVLKDLNIPYEGPGDVFLPVEHGKAASLEKAASAREWSGWAREALRPTELQKLSMEAQQEREVKQAFVECLLESQAERNQAALNFMKTARDLALEDGRTLDEILSMVKEARKGSQAHEKQATDLLAIVAVNTGQKFAAGSGQIEKVSNLILDRREPEMPAEDIRDRENKGYAMWVRSPGARTEDMVGPVCSGKNPVTVINGTHSLFMDLDTLVDQTDKENWYGKGLLISGDRVRTAARNVVNWSSKTESV